MSLPKSEQRALVAIAEQCAETRRPISTMIVLAACNARTGAEADSLLVHLASLKRQGLITQHGDAWEATPEGYQAARRIMAGQAPDKPKVEPIPEPSKPRDTLRPRVLTAPKPITRPSPQAKVGHGASSTACDDQWAPLPEEFTVDPWPESRADIIGQNGPTGDHYPRQPEALTLPISRELLERCAAMQLTLLHEAQQAFSDGEPGAVAELAWLLETGRQLLAAGGES